MANVFGPGTRESRILDGLDRQRLGLEIGPSHRPVAAKRDGFNVRILDHMTAGELRHKYEAHGVDLDRIEAVDYVWHGEKLRDLVGGERFAWIIASHVIEHTPDLVGFLEDCQEILAPDGVLSLAVPDKRFCFDVLREVTSIAQVIDAHELGRTVHTPGAVADYFMNVARRHGAIAWDTRGVDGLEFGHSVREALECMPLARDGHYIDLHAWCFTPSSFRLMMIDLNLLGLIGLTEARFFETVGHEFFVALRPGQASAERRMDLQIAKLREIAEPFTAP